MLVNGELADLIRSERDYDRGRPPIVIRDWLDLGRTIKPPRYLTKDIIRQVAFTQRVAPSEILGPSRARHLVHARQLAVYLARALTNLSMPRLGKQFKRDHTTLLHAEQQVMARYGLPKARECDRAVALRLLVAGE
jgi:hypothetical protein